MSIRNIFVLALLVVGSVAGASSTTNTILPHGRGHGITSPFVHPKSAQRVVVAAKELRGGAAPFGKNKVATANAKNRISKADVIKAHAWACLAYGILFALESFDISILPMLGFSELFKDFASASSTEFTKAAMRIVAGLSLFTHLVEKELAENETVQKAFGWYHAALAVMSFLLAKEGAANNLGVVVASVPLGFGALWLVAK